MTPYCHIHKKAIGPNRNYYRIYFDFIPRLIQITRKGNLFKQTTNVIYYRK